MKKSINKIKVQEIKSGRMKNLNGEKIGPWTVVFDFGKTLLLSHESTTEVYSRTRAFVNSIRAYHKKAALWKACKKLTE